MKKKSTYGIAEQIGNHGFYGEIEIEFQVTKDYGELNLFLSDDLNQWRPGIIFGATYFIEHCYDRIGLNISVVNIDFHEVDTTNTIIAYLICNALMKESDLDIKQGIVFNKDQKSFIFAK